MSDTLYFSANDGQNGLEIWSSDGTESRNSENFSISLLGIYPFGCAAHHPLWWL